MWQRTNRPGKLDPDRAAADDVALERLLGRAGVLGALEVDERVIPRRVGRGAVERAVLGKDAHEIRIGGLGGKISDPEIVRGGGLVLISLLPTPRLLLRVWIRCGRVLLRRGRRHGRLQKP